MEFINELSVEHVLVATAVLLFLLIIVLIRNSSRIKRLNRENDTRQKELMNRLEKVSSSETALKASEVALRNEVEQKRVELREALKEDTMRQIATELEKVQIDIGKAIADYGERLLKLADLQQKINGAEEQLEGTEKKCVTAENRIKKVALTYKSMEYALKSYVDPTLDITTLINRFAIDLNDFNSIMQPDLKCFSYKELRSRFRQNKKEIANVLDEYRDRYTTKANASIYQLMVLALDSELQNILLTITYGKLDSMLEKVNILIAKLYAIAVQGNQNIAPTIQRFIGQIEGLYVNAVTIEYEAYVLRERAKEEQRAIREQMRQEAEERKLLEQQRQQIENEEKKYLSEMERLNAQLTTASTEDAEVISSRLADLQAQVDTLETKKEDIIKLQNGKAGTVYIISNIGSLGDHTFKVGMTRRFEPQDRVNELGGASVPFPFDVHSFIFSNDAVALETALHKRLNDRRVNKINLRKEFFDITGEELQSLVEEIDPTAPFTLTALAEQYRQSQSVEVVPDSVDIEIDDEEFEEE